MYIRYSVNTLDIFLESFYIVGQSSFFFLDTNGPTPLQKKKKHQMQQGCKGNISLGRNKQKLPQKLTFSRQLITSSNFFVTPHTNNVVWTQHLVKLLEQIIFYFLLFHNVN